MVFTQDGLPAGIPLELIYFLLDSLEFPTPHEVKKATSQGTYHLNYVLTFKTKDLDTILTPLSHKYPFDSGSLLLRIAGNHLPRIKTENESAVLAYIARYTDVPVPAIVRFSPNTHNPLGHEYQLMTISLGEPIDAHFHDIDEATAKSILDQMADILEQLHSLRVHHIGGFQFGFENDDREFSAGLKPTAHTLPGPLCEEFLWQTPAIAKYWEPYGLNEMPEALNAQGPFTTWTSYSVAWLRMYIYAICRHPLLDGMRDLVPRLEALIAFLSDEKIVEKFKLDKMRFVLAHRDLHFSNILWDRDTKRITAVLDWEFSGAAPFCRWDPPKAFLASLPWDEEGIRRKRRWVEMFKERCRERGIKWRKLIWDGDSEELGWSTEEQKWVFFAVDYLRCICEVGPTGERSEALGDWRREVEANLRKLGIEA